MNWVWKLKGLAACSAAIAMASAPPESDILLGGLRGNVALSGLSKPLVLLREVCKRSFMSFQLLVFVLVVLLARESGRSGSRSTTSSGGGWMRKGGRGDVPGEISSDSMGPERREPSDNKKTGGGEGALGC